MSSGRLRVSCMPVVDEADELAPASTPSSSRLAAAAQRAREREEAWRAEADAFLADPTACRARVVMLLQEIFRSCAARLEADVARGEVTPAERQQRATALRDAFAAIKLEFCRTLERSCQGPDGDSAVSQSRQQSSSAPPSATSARELAPAEVARRAVEAFASVRPWSSAGFLMSYKENIQFGVACDVPSETPEAPPPSLPTSAIRRSRVSLPPATPADPLDVSPPQSPTTRSLSGPLMPHESRCFAREQLVRAGNAFVCRSLAAAGFFAARRAGAIKAALKRRLALYQSDSPASPLSWPAPKTVFGDGSGDYSCGASDGSLPNSRRLCVSDAPSCRRAAASFPNAGDDDDEPVEQRPADCVRVVWKVHYASTCSPAT